MHKSQLNREFDMSFKKASLVAMLAVSMTGTQVLAQTATAASAAPTTAARSGAGMQDSNELRGGAFIALLALIAVIIGILCLIQDGDNPTSP